MRRVAIKGVQIAVLWGGGLKTRDLTSRDWTTRHQIKQWCHCPVAVRIDCCLYCRSNSGVRARLTRTCWTISELYPVCHDSTAALTVACSFCVQSAILSALIRSPCSRSEDEDEDRQAPVSAATTSGASESAAAAATSDDCCEVCLVAPRAGFALVPCGHARFCEACAMRVSVRELANLFCRTHE